MSTAAKERERVCACVCLLRVLGSVQYRKVHHTLWFQFRAFRQYVDFKPSPVIYFWTVELYTYASNGKNK